MVRRRRLCKNFRRRRREPARWFLKIGGGGVNRRADVIMNENVYFTEQFVTKARGDGAAHSGRVFDDAITTKFR